MQEELLDSSQGLGGCNEKGNGVQETESLAKGSWMQQLPGGDATCAC